MNTAQGFGQKAPPVTGQRAQNLTPKPPASDRIHALNRRHGWLVIAAQVLWLLAMLMQLASGLIMPTAPLHHDDLAPVIDVPRDLADDLAAQAHPLSPAGFTAPSLGVFYFPARSFDLFIETLCLTAVVAAIRRKWAYYFVVVALMATPPTFFGNSGILVPPVALVAAIAAVASALMGRQFKIAGAAVAVFVAVSAWQVYGTNATLSTPVIVASQPATPGQAGPLDAYDSVLTSAATRHPAAVAYVRAQDAYMAHDWRRLQAIGPVDAGAFGGTPFKMARLKTLAQALHDLKRPADAPLERPPFDVFLVRLQIALQLLALALSLFAWHVYRRVRRVEALEIQLSPQRRTA